MDCRKTSHTHGRLGHAQDRGGTHSVYDSGCTISTILMTAGPNLEQLTS